MKITSFAVARPERRTDQPYLAKFNLSVNEDVELCGLMLRSRDDGSLYIATPRHGTGNFAILSSSFREALLQIVTPMYDVMRASGARPAVIAAG